MKVSKEYLDISVDGQIARLTMNRPHKRNAMCDELLEAIDAFFSKPPKETKVVVLTGTAEIEPSAPAADQNPAYIEKYADGIASINMTPESFAATYSVPIRVTPSKVRGF